MQAFVYGYGTSWSPYYFPVIAFLILEGLVAIPWSLRFTLKQLGQSWYGRVWKPLSALCGHYLTVIVLVGMVDSAVPLPFDSATWTTVAMFILVCSSSCSKSSSGHVMASSHLEAHDTAGASLSYFQHDQCARSRCPHAMNYHATHVITHDGLWNTCFVLSVYLLLLPPWLIRATLTSV